jgi:hypothetical protein
MRDYSPPSAALQEIDRSPGNSGCRPALRTAAIAATATLGCSAYLDIARRKQIEMASVSGEGA